MKYSNIYVSIICSLFVLASTKTLNAQELNAQVQVNSEKIQRTNKQVFTTLETAIREFLNNRKWTDEKYAQEERIRCSFNITINENPSVDQFVANIQVQYSRPIYASAYDSPVFLHQDNQFSFRYLEFDRLDFAENQSISNLTSVLAYYVYVIIGHDRDTYELKGGTPFYQQAQSIVGASQGGNFQGWNSFSGPKSRFELIENLTSPAFENYRIYLYSYHRLGLDTMYDPAEQDKAKKTIMDALLLLKDVNDKRPNSLLVQILFDAKANEILSIFNGGNPLDVRPLKELLPTLDATNANKYQQMGAG
jgi:hypothetical protein